MNNLSFDKILKFFPSVYDWIEQQENEIFVTGRNLYLNEMKVAKEIGIKNYDILKTISKREKCLLSFSKFLNSSRPISIVHFGPIWISMMRSN